MNVFEAVKQNLTTRQAAEMYGIQVSRHGMTVCPFHNDKNPSMKVDKRFHCFACEYYQSRLCERGDRRFGKLVARCDCFFSLSGSFGRLFGDDR